MQFPYIITVCDLLCFFPAILFSCTLSEAFVDLKKERLAIG
jgi:hypothetical protein